jgi:signal peptidase I
MDPGGKHAARMRKEAIAFARAARRAARRHQKRLKGARKEIDAAAAEVEQAAAGDELEPVSGALRRLDGLWDQHIAPLRAGLPRRILLGLAAAVVAALLLRGFLVESLAVTSGSMAPTLLAGDRVLVWKPAYGLRLPFAGLRPGDAVLPRRGDVVVIGGPGRRGGDWIKRVVGLPGDVIEIREQVLLVNGVPQPRNPSGELAYDELNEETGIWWTDTCRVVRERLARGALSRPASGLPVDQETSWEAGARGGVSTYGVLQCRRVRNDTREGPFEPVKPGHVFVLGDNRDRSADSRMEGGWQVPLRQIKGRVVAVAWNSGSKGAGAGARRPMRFDRLFKLVE